MSDVKKLESGNFTWALVKTSPLTPRKSKIGFNRGNILTYNAKDKDC